MHPGDLEVAGRMGVPAADGRRSSWELVCAAGTAGRAGRAPSADPAWRLPVAEGCGGGAGAAAGARPGDQGGRVLTVGDWLAHGSAPGGLAPARKRSQYLTYRYDVAVPVG